jgi:hypothetical protein
MAVAAAGVRGRHSARPMEYARVRNLLIRMSYPLTLTLSTGRCGTTFLYNTFRPDHEALHVSHESLHANLAGPALYHRAYDKATQQEMLGQPRLRQQIDDWLAIAEKRPVVEFGWTMAATAPLLHGLIGKRLRILVLHRHPVEVAGSFANLGYYRVVKSPSSAITPYHARVLYGSFRARWKDMSPYERGLYRWLEINAFAQECLQSLEIVRSLVLSSEALFADTSSALRSIAMLLRDDERHPPPSPLRNAIPPHYRERWPVRGEWRKTLEYEEVSALADRLGHTMTFPEIERRVAHYRLPRGPGASIRHFSGYWALREWAGRLRERALRGISTGVHRLRNP